MNHNSRRRAGLTEERDGKIVFKDPAAQEKLMEQAKNCNAAARYAHAKRRKSFGNAS